MGKWNTTGKIKALVLVLLAIPNLIAPINTFGHKTPEFVFMATIFGCIAIPLIARFNAAGGKEIIDPNWNDNPITLKRPLAMFHFYAYFFMVVGLSMVAGTAIKFNTLNYFGLASIGFGVGILVGIRLSLRWIK